MIQRPYGGLRGNCLGGCKKGFYDSSLLPESILRAQGQDLVEASKLRQAHEGIFSSDLNTRPFAYERIFRQLNLSQEDFQAFTSMVEEQRSLTEIRHYVFPLVFEALGLHSDTVPEKIYSLSMSAARKLFYESVVEFRRRYFCRNLEFWNPEDKAFYNVVFGEFNFAWMAVIDIFESEEFNPKQAKFKRLYPEKQEDIGTSIYTPNKPGPAGSVTVDLRSELQVPKNSIVIYRQGSTFTHTFLREGEKNWTSQELNVSELWNIDAKPGHIECVVQGKKGRAFCSDGRLDKPATEWTKDRKILAIYEVLN